MTETNADTKETTPPPAIDVDKLKSELAAQNADLLNTVMSKINEKREEKIDNPQEFSYDEALEEFKEDLEDLRVDGTQAKALMKIFNKMLSKENPKVKKEIITEVNQTQKFIKDKDAAETEIATLYPDITNKNSKLFKQAQIEFAKLSTSVKNSVEGTSTAVMKAAAVLGIPPVDLKMLRALEATGPGSAGGRPGAETKVTQKQADFASYFGIKKDKFEEKLKNIKEKSRKSSQLIIFFTKII